MNFDPQGGGGDSPSSSSESEEDGDNGEGGGYMLLPQEPTELDCEGVEQSLPVSRDTGVHSAIYGEHCDFSIRSKWSEYCTREC